MKQKTELNFENDNDTIKIDLNNKKTIDLNILYDNEKRLSHLPASLMLTYIPVI